MNLSLGRELPSFLATAQGLPDGVTLRDEAGTADIEFIADLYAATRAEELRPLAWGQADKRAFLRQQFDLQRAHYHQHYPGAEWLIAMVDAAPAGRLYLKAGEAEVRLMDVALVEAHRGRGIGTALTRSVLLYADALGLPVSLHVETFNPALRLYQRLGFKTVEVRGIYRFMQRVRGAAPTQLNVIS